MAELRANALLRSLRPAALRAVVGSSDVLEVASGDATRLDGSPGGWIDFPLTALLSVVVSDPSGTSVAVAMVGPEGATGLSGALTGIEPLPGVVCAIGGRVARLPTGEVRRLFDLDPNFRAASVRCLGAELAEIVQVSACNRLHPLSDRLANWLLCASARTGRDELPATHDLLARLLGASRPNVSEALEAFAHQGVVETQRGAVRIVDRAGLAACGSNCAAALADLVGRPASPGGRVARAGRGPRPRA